MDNRDDEKASPERVARMFGFKNGRFYWKTRPLSDFKSERAYDIWQRHNANADVMWLGGRAWNTKKLRQTVSIDGKIYRIEDVFWCWFHGYWPDGRVIRIDGNEDNNHSSNLACI